MALIPRKPPAEFGSLAPFTRMQNELNRLLTSLSPSQEESLTAWAPEVDIYEDDKGIQVRADIPGIDPKNLTVNVESGMLTIAGERSQEKEEKKENFHRMERSYGSFSRSFSLPEYADVEKIEATYKNGVLQVAIPTKPGAEKHGKKIAVKTQ